MATSSAPEFPSGCVAGRRPGPMVRAVQAGVAIVAPVIEAPATTAVAAGRKVAPKVRPLVTRQQPKRGPMAGPSMSVASR